MTFRAVAHQGQTPRQSCATQQYLSLPLNLPVASHARWLLATMKMMTMLFHCESADAMTMQLCPALRLLRQIPKPQAVTKKRTWFSNRRAMKKDRNRCTRESTGGDHQQLWFPKDDVTSAEKRKRSSPAARVNGRWRSDFDPSPDGDMPEIIAGVTQNGKTLIKVLAIVVGHLLGVCSIIISTTKKCRGLPQKQDRLRSTSIVTCIQSSNPTSNWHISELDEHGYGPQPMCNFLRKHGCLFINDTSRQISNASRTIDKARALFQLILDEADSYYRRSSNPIQLELALENIQAKIRPILRWRVCATLMPVFLHLKDKQMGKLEDNGFQHVTVLTYRPQDFDSAQAHPQWLSELLEKIRTPRQQIGEVTSSSAI
ncbi:hypothetical protein GUITHDRAFT_146960 [Guillardia theta CCMP2712]|uniref:Uncharacterized protein n=1 Tax=Guillardia theta (strain CCMP2712) TaxID=905079 RepID=L1IES9_GUITC|nr:hypothetical protein GUITHDRAFT_146960 [Guillardia theta CCMP2712]EKX34738.1 hypothetical protein GUITHDRAFT_146960 [Guillardia theta CCMP2712]|eukprot:XP_005821718.1 hypothetical protein GUITHDRAFT_146960 [Guillardia theta CCMP2712]